MPKLFVGNWKMSLSDDEAVDLAAVFAGIKAPPDLEVAVAPGFTALHRVAAELKDSDVALAAQDAFWADTGAYTGEVSPRGLASLGARYVILGHSERRQHMGETDEMVNKKAAAALAAGLTPIICVGETLEEKEAGRREDVVRGQVAAALKGFSITAEAPVVIAYEPRWAIGSGMPCLPEDAVRVHELIRSIVPVRVLYGGSVDASNIASYVSESAIDGVLVGGASTKADQITPMLAAFA